MRSKHATAFGRSSACLNLSNRPGTRTVSFQNRCRGKSCNGVLRGVTVSEAIDIAGFPRLGTTGRLPLGLSRKKTIRVEYYVGRMVFGRPISPGCLEPE